MSKDQSTQLASIAVGILGILIALLLGWWVLGFIRRILRLLILLAVIAGAGIAINNARSS